MAKHLIMQIRYKKKPLHHTGTTTQEAPPNLVSGTVLQIAGAGLNLTCAPSLPWVLSTLSTTGHFRIVGEIKPQVRRQTRESRRVKIRTPELIVPGTKEGVEALGRKSSGREIVLKEKIKHLIASEPGVRLLGHAGSAVGPSKKYYDVDLDEYQLD